MTKAPILILLANLVSLSWRSDVLVQSRLAEGDSQNSRELKRKPMSQVDPQECPGLYPTRIAFNLTKDFVVQKVNVSLRLAEIVRSQEFGPIEDLVEEQRRIYERFDGWSDINDQALVAKTHDPPICFVAFQSTQDLENFIPFVLDQWQNVNPFHTRIRDCKVRNGYLDSYNASSYKKQMRQAIDSCVDSCQWKNCELVFTGYSQGASAAIVGAIDLAHYHPETITFATPKTVLNFKNYPCTTIDNLRNIRFVNTDARGSYDAVPNQINIFGERHAGKLFLLNDFNFPLTIPTGQMQEDRYPRNVALHEWEIYRDRMRAWINGNCFPIPAGGRQPGEWCGYHNECQSQKCEKKRCVAGL